jgi:hypothetical protein
MRRPTVLWGLHTTCLAQFPSFAGDGRSAARGTGMIPSHRPQVPLRDAHGRSESSGCFARWSKLSDSTRPA